ncbi:OLC1v1020549C1 [Oldenlandia corymbosa var. corymbosa]|uniref:OLC1v1020549C1 n=1 Tax=Oldenlandia corymbosa var. corymbosa TaxID=529605 RepID=A0AAV1EH68_OLDCO|nr:OLC1v1020549C1 [Oldenlandia corymbosa var. corymbosa]
MGIPFRCNNFQMMEIQAKWIAFVLSKKVNLPSKEEMLADVEEYYKQLEEDEIPKRYTHRLPWNQFEYLDWIVAEAKLPPISKQTKEITRRLFSVLDPWVRYREHYSELTLKTRSIDDDHFDINIQKHISRSFQFRKSFKILA